MQSIHRTARGAATVAACAGMLLAASWGPPAQAQAPQAEPTEQPPAWDLRGQVLLAAQAGFTELLDESLDGWVVENGPAANFSITDEGVLRVVEPEGWLRSREQYTDFRLRVEFRFLTDDADTGIFLRASSEDTFARGWPSGSYQVQMLNPHAEEWPFPPLGAIFRHGMPSGPTRFDAEDARRLAAPTGEWQTLEIELIGEDLTVWLNDELLTEASEIQTPGRYIGIQGETGMTEFRSLAIQEL